MNNMDKFISSYGKHLEQSKKDHPDDYTWSLREFTDVFVRMADAIRRGTFNKESHAFKRTCKELGIRHTYKAIYEFCSQPIEQAPCIVCGAAGDHDEGCTVAEGT